MVCGIWYENGIHSVFEYVSHASHSGCLQRSASIPCFTLLDKNNIYIYTGDGGRINIDGGGDYIQTYGMSCFCCRWRIHEATVERGRSWEELVEESL